MKQATADCVLTAISKVQEGISADVVAAVVTLEGVKDPQLNQTYWDGGLIDQTWERICASFAYQRGVKRGCLAVPAYVIETDDKIDLRAPQPPTWDNEEEIIWALAFDVEHGFDMCRSTVHRTATGQVLYFGDVQQLHGPVTLHPTGPGSVLLEWLTKEY